MRGGRYSNRRRSADVDESLFGNTRSQILKKAGRRASRRREQNQIADSTPIILRSADITRMKKSSERKSPAQLQREREEIKRQRQEEMQHAYDRKMEMIRQEEERKKNLPPSKLDMIKLQEDEVIKQRAQVLLDEKEDEVKVMNQMMQYAQTVTIRDQQLKEAREVRRIRQLEEKKVDMQMELDRIRGVKELNERERVRRQKHRDDCKHILVQIAERKKQRERDRELKRQEQEKIKQRAKELEEEEQIFLEMKRIEGKKLLADVLEANRLALEIKKQNKLREIEEEKKIHEYLEAKAAREQAHEEEKARIAAKKERECAMLRAQQKKIADNRAAIDQLRAKRDAEATERKARERELREAAERKRRQAELMEFNRLQALARKQTLANEEAVDRAEFERNNVHLTRELARFNADKKRRHDARIANRNQIQEQIVEREKKRRESLKRFIESGKEAVRDNEIHIKKLNRIKKEKVEELKRMGVPSKYCAELLHHDPEKSILNDYRRKGW